MNGHNTGPWVVRAGSGCALIERADAAQNMRLRLEGDFGTGAQKLAFAQQVANSLNNQVAAREPLDALRDVLKTREAEAKAAMAYTRAHENFGDARREAAIHTRAMVAASAAEAKARAVIAKATGDAK